MSAADLLKPADPNVPRVAFKRTTRMGWDPAQRGRVVMVAVLDRDGRHGLVIGAEGGQAVVLERAEATGVTRKGQAVVVQLADGREWATYPVGCSCNVPAPLKGLDPMALL